MRICARVLTAERAAGVASVRRSQGLPHFRHSQFQTVLGGYTTVIAGPRPSTNLYENMFLKVQKTPDRERNLGKERVRNSRRNTKVRGEGGAWHHSRYPHCSL